MSFLDKQTRKYTKVKRAEKPPRQTKEGYLIKRSGELVMREWEGPIPKPKEGLSTVEDLGSIDWSAAQVYGSVEEFIRLMEAITVGADHTTGLKWRRLPLLYRYWQHEYRGGKLDSPPSLEQVCFALKISGAELWAFIGTAQKALFTQLAIRKAEAASIEIIDLAIKAARDIENGGKDREMLLEIAGVKASKGGVNVNVNQQMAFMKNDESKTPLLQFRQTTDEIDSNIRALLKEAPETVDGAIDADFTEQKEIEYADKSDSDNET